MRLPGLPGLWTRVSIQFKFVCVALNHRHSLKGFNGPYVYDAPLTLAPQRGKKKKLP